MTAPALDRPRFVVRPIQDSEIPLVYSSWLHTAHDAVWGHNVLNHGVRTGRTDGVKELAHLQALSRREFFAAERARADALLGRHGAMAAVLPSVPDEVLGWVCVRPRGQEIAAVLHFAFTKRDFRGAGVCHALLAATGLIPGSFDVSFLSHDVKAWKTNGRAIRYNPLAR